MLQRLPRLAPALAVVLLAFSPTPSGAVTFVESGASLLGVSGTSIRAASAWADYDGDGDLDLLVAGTSDGSPSGGRTRLYRNTGGAFAVVPTALPNLGNSGFAWGDYDRDGDLDLALQGVDSTSAFRTGIYRNDGGDTFTDIAAGLTAVSTGTMAWGDVDGDGDLDLAYCGSTSAAASGATTKVYRNDGGTFIDASAGIATAGQNGAVGLGDVDGDGDLDLLVTGANTASTAIASLYRNDAGAWVEVASGISAVALGSAVAFGDADNDGDLDLATLGSIVGFAAGFVRIYSNNGSGVFTGLSTTLTGLSTGSLAWGDFDGDGDLDLLAAGATTTSNVRLTYIARNDGGGTYTQVAPGLPNVGQGTVTWGDYDDDGRLDAAVVGLEAVGVRLAKIYRNTDAPVNAAPGVPSGLTTSVLAGPDSVAVTFSWIAPTDDHTPQSGLSYELRVGTTPGGSEITGSAAAASGFRRVARLGSTGGRESWTLVLPSGVYHWSVQAVDGGLRGSAFAATPQLVDAGFALLGARAGTAHLGIAWADDDGDGDVDLLVAGSTDGSLANAKTRLYRNGDGVLSMLPTSLPNVTNGAMAWGDYDRDGDLDLALQGADSTLTRVTGIYRNDGGGVFTNSGAALVGLAAGGVAWCDYDRDGDLDLAVCGTANGATSGATTRLYRNDAGTFVDALPGMTGLHHSAVAWGDLDGDGDADLLMGGLIPSGPARTVRYRNDNGTLVEVPSGLPDLGYSAIAFGDSDGDGDLDLAMSGSGSSSTSDAITRVYTNDGAGNFTQSAILTGTGLGSLAWGDLDADGDLDLAFIGTGEGFGTTRIARNDGGTFTELALELPNLRLGALAWGDVDRDGRLDLALCGDTGAGVITRVYRNVLTAVNAAPSAPSGLTHTGSFPDKVLHWDPASDSRTPAAGLSYDVRVGISTRGGQIVSLPADSVSGLRRVAQRGAAQTNSLAITLPAGVYYFTVQAIDASFAGSALPAWQTISDGTLGVEPNVDLPTALAIRGVSPNPMAASALVGFDLPREADVDLSVYDASGRHVATLVKARFAAGRQAARWDGRGDHGGIAAAGVYFVRLRAGAQTISRRLVRVR